MKYVNVYSHVVQENVNGVAALENSLVVSQKVKGRITREPSSSTPRYKPKRTEEMYSNRCIYMCVHSSDIHKSQKVETIQVSVSR